MLSIFANFLILTNRSPFSRSSSVWNDVQTSLYWTWSQISNCFVLIWRTSCSGNQYIVWVIMTRSYMLMLWLISTYISMLKKTTRLRCSFTKKYEVQNKQLSLVSGELWFSPSKSPPTDSPCFIPVSYK